MSKTKLAVFAAKFTRKSLRLLGKGATTLPGKIALKVSPSVIKDLSKNKNIITITGTNGKTTSSHMISEMLTSMGYDVINNISGANLASGIATTLICEKGTGKGDKVYVLETDEAAFAKIAGDLNPKVSVVTNLFRDQLDRYGELTHTRDCIANGIDMTSAKLILNADDSLVASLGKGREEKSIFFGIDKATMKSNNVKYPAKKGVLEASSDAVYCPNCNVKYEYESRSFGHLGNFKCPSCGFKSPLERFGIIYDGGISPSMDNFPFSIKDNGSGETKDITLKIPGSHNLYNTCGAIAAVEVFEEVTKGKTNDREIFTRACEAQSHVKAAFGRMEKIAVGDKNLCILLVKNPVGLDRSLSFVAESSDADALMLCLNSNFADGKDVSWIWDVDFESKAEDLPSKIYVSGQRYGDMKLRVTYSGCNVTESGDMSHVMEMLKKALEECPAGKCVYVLPNYTSMLDLRGRLVNELGLKDFWK
ncbi:MAG: MurT ligase domain-containing protein [Saccharofermentans sp.]|nr:MurT ligase domain-containing protein [Saccharofermentans sp.]